MREDTITAVGPNFVREGHLMVSFEDDKLPTQVLAQNAVAEYQLRKDALALMRVSEAKGRLIGRIEAALVATLFWLAVAGAVSLWGMR